MSGTTDVEDTLKDFWATRPRRPRRGRKCAGVAAGIGNRYGIDPTVVRVAFVVATFYGGAGVLFYLLGWLFLPEQDDEAAPLEGMVKRRRSSTSAAFTVLLCLALIPAFWLFVDNQFSGIMGVLIGAGTLFLLHRGRGHLNRPPGADVPVPETFAPTSSSFATPMPATPTASAAAEPATVRASDVPTAEPKPPAWDPLGAAPFAWDLPEPSPPTPEPPAPGRRSRVGLFTVGIHLVTVGVLAIAYRYTDWITPAHIVGILLGVVGLSMVGGSFVRSGRGLIGLAVPLAVIGIGLTVISPDGWHGVGDLREQPAMLTDVRDSYKVSAGRIELDLTRLPASGDVSTHVEVDGPGEVLVIVPRTADVDLECVAGLGELVCLDQRADSSDPELSVTHEGADGSGGLRVELHAEVGVGRVEVRRG